MRNNILLLLIFIGYGPVSLACTTFFINKDGQKVFGRNYDWVTGSGMICTNQRGLFKTSSKTRDGETISWVSQFGSITFNQYGKEFPMGGMNEKGLVVELMWLDGTIYPRPDDRPALGVLQWIQFQLDNSSTVGDVIASDNKIRIASRGTTPLHYLVADTNGNVATIEFLDGKMVVHTGKDLPFPVLTNDKYEESVKLTADALAEENNKRTFTNNSIDRFARVCRMVTDYKSRSPSVPILDYSFHILQAVSQGEHTRWSIVYDITNMKVYFHTQGFPERKSVDLRFFNLACNVSSKAWDMNQPGRGDISSDFIDFSLSLNQRVVAASFDESSSQIEVSKEAQKQTWEYPTTITCKNPGQ